MARNLNGRFRLGDPGLGNVAASGRQGSGVGSCSYCCPDLNNDGLACCCNGEDTVATSRQVMGFAFQLENIFTHCEGPNDLHGLSLPPFLIYNNLLCMMVCSPRLPAASRKTEKFLFPPTPCPGPPGPVGPAQTAWRCQCDQAVCAPLTGTTPKRQGPEIFRPCGPARLPRRRAQAFTTIVQLWVCFNFLHCVGIR